MKGKAGILMGENDDIHEEISLCFGRDNALGIHIGDASLGHGTIGALAG